MNSRQNLLVVVAGPTASGKTNLAISLAKKYDTAVISADSRQLYREMQVGTARPQENELKGVPHYLLGSESIHHPLTAGQFAERALSILNELFQKNRIVIMAGGTGLYIKAVCEGLDELPRDLPMRKRLQDEWDTDSEKLKSELIDRDPVYAEAADLSNPVRVIRALEVIRLSDKPYSELRSGKKHPRPFQSIYFGIELDREELYKRINLRVSQMMDAGLLEEAKRLFPFKKLEPLNTVGYNELFQHLDGKISLDEAVQLIRRNTRRYAKRQLTWFRKIHEMNWLASDNLDKMDQIIAESSSATN